MGMVIVVSRFKSLERCKTEGVLSYSGFLCGIKVNKIVVGKIYDLVEKDAIYLVTLKGARIKGSVLYAELLKMRKLQEVNF